MTKRAVQPDDDARRDVEPGAEAPRLVAPDAAAVLMLQEQAGNTAVSRLLAGKAAGGGATLHRWKNLGNESWQLEGLRRRSMTVWAGTKEEWSSRLDEIDDEDEYNEEIWGFLRASNDPSIVGRDRPPSDISEDAASVDYKNTIVRAPTTAEKLAFLEALYEKAGPLDLWHRGIGEGGPWTKWADQDLATFIAQNQSLYLTARANAGDRLDDDGVAAVASQGGKSATTAMITNAGATAHKAVDLVITAHRMEDGPPKEVAMANAKQLVRNSAQTIRYALDGQKSRVAFERAVVGFVFEQVWGMIPGGGQLVSAGKALLKLGFEDALDKATADGGPAAQAQTIHKGFVHTCNQLVKSGHVKDADCQDAINAFEAAIQ